MSFIARYKEMSAPVKASIWYTICDVIQKGLTVLTIPIFTRIMSTAEYGLTTVYNSWFAIIVIFATLNLQYGTFNTAMMEFEDERDRFVSAMQGLVTTSVFVVFIIYLLIRPLAEDLTKLSFPLFAVMAVQMIATTIFGFWSGKKRFEYSYKGIVAVTLISAFLATIISIIMVIVVETDKGEVKIISTVLVQALVFVPIYVSVFKKGRTFFNKRFWKFALGMNLALIPYYLAQAVFNNSDLLMIEWFCGMSDAALYGTAFTFGTIMAFVLNAINNSFVPWKYQSIKSGSYAPIGKAANGIAAFVAFLLMIFMLFGPEIMRVLAAPAYYDARWVIPPVAASMFFLFLVQQLVDIEFLLKSRLMLVAGSAVAAISNIILNALLIPIFGYIVAAYTTLLSYIIFVVCNYFAAKHSIRVNQVAYRVSDVFDLKMLLLMSLGVLAFLALCNFLYLSDVARFISIGVFVVIGIALRKRIAKVLQSFR